MIQAVMNLISGTPPVAAPKDVSKYEVNADTDEGEVVKLNNDGTVEPSAQDLTDAYGIALEDGESATDDEIRVQIIVPGVVLKGEVDQAVTVGTDVGLNGDRDGFDNGQTGAIVIKYQADVGNWDHCVWAVPYNGLLFQDNQ